MSRDCQKELSAAKEEIARLNATYYADNQLFIDQRRELANAEKHNVELCKQLLESEGHITELRKQVLLTQAREQKLREAIEEAMDEEWRLAGEPTSVYTILHHALHTKEEEAK